MQLTRMLPGMQVNIDTYRVKNNNGELSIFTRVVNPNEPDNEDNYFQRKLDHSILDYDQLVSLTTYLLTLIDHLAGEMVPKQSAEWQTSKENLSSMFYKRVVLKPDQEYIPTNHGQHKVQEFTLPAETAMEAIEQLKQVVNLPAAEGALQVILTTREGSHEHSGPYSATAVFLDRVVPVVPA